MAATRTSPTTDLALLLCRPPEPTSGLYHRVHARACMKLYVATVNEHKLTFMLSGIHRRLVDF